MPADYDYDYSNPGANLVAEPVDSTVEHNSECEGLQAEGNPLDAAAEPCKPSKRYISCHSQPWKFKPFLSGVLQPSPEHRCLSWCVAPPEKFSTNKQCSDRSHPVALH